MSTLRKDDVAVPDVKLVQELQRVPLTNENLVILVIRCMQHIATATAMTGEQKKAWVLATIRHIIQSHPELNEVQKFELLRAADTLLPATIDSLVAASKGAYEFSVRVGTWCCKNC